MATDLLHLLLMILPFALASMVSPLAIITVIAVLSATKRRALKAVLFAITYATAFSATCLLLIAVGRFSIHLNMICYVDMNYIFK
jgi:predicted lipid-binding transport protein (Tim44 family)